MQYDAKEVAKELGWPEGIPLQGGSVVWMVSPGDDAMTATISFDGVTVCASLILRYFGKIVTMLKAVFANGKWHSDGIMANVASDDSQIVNHFQSHVENMMGGPHFIEGVYE